MRAKDLPKLGGQPKKLSDKAKANLMKGKHEQALKMNAAYDKYLASLREQGTSKIELKQGNACVTKKHYKTADAASHAAVTLMSKGVSGKQLYAYSCKHCKDWHLTSKPFKIKIMNPRIKTSKISDKN